MKASIKDHLTIVMAFAAVFLCGYGIGHQLGARQSPPTTAPADPAWEVESLSLLQDALQLGPAETGIVEQEIGVTAGKIRASRQQTVLEYHQHLNELYGRLIEQLGEPSASRLRVEKEQIEREIEMLKESLPAPATDE